MELPREFVKMMEKMPGVDIGMFLSSMQRDVPVSVRLNSRKPGASFEGMKPVKWCENAFYLPQRPDFIFDPLLHAGAYYVQEASSTIYETVTKNISGKLGNIPLNVLDTCAAPGGKTTAIINGLPDGSFVWANEYVAKRASILKENLTKWGYPDIKVTNLDTSFFSRGDQLFDIVAVDAPCSGEGMMRKDEFAIKQWSPDLVSKCASLQKEILKNVSSSVAPGGFLIYSTCTFNTVENETNALFIKDELGFEPYNLSFPSEWGILPGIDVNFPVYRFMPHATEGEGLFLAVFRKPGEWKQRKISESKIEPANRDSLKKNNKLKEDNKRAKKSHNKIKESDDGLTVEKILSVDFNPDSVISVNLKLEEALTYLRGETIILDPSVPKGTVVVKYNDFPLGAVKNIGTRANNLYPKPWRIKKVL